MKNLLFPFCVFVSILFLSCNQTDQVNLNAIDPGRYDTNWYNHTPQRFVQTNLSDTDATMDINVYVKSLVDISANFVVFNVGGITANYPTKLPFHFRNPYLKRDLTGEVIKKFHENGIKVIGRFDFSKVDESIAVKNPGWLYLGIDGKIVNYYGKVHTCINGGYQQEYGFEILKEAIAAYPLDGIFFNMGGYQTSDYSQVNHGLCQCQNCKKRFRDSTGIALPVLPDMNDPVYRQYQAFQRSTSDELFRRIKSFIKNLNPDLVLVHEVGEMIRSESGTGFTTGQDWNYHATENVKRILGSYRDKTPTDSYNYLIGMDFRHTATSPNIGKIFMAEQMLNGTSPGIYVMGRLENQYDRVFLPTLKELFRFHKTNEKLFTNVQSLSRIGLIMGSAQEYRGIMKILIEGHVMFDLIRPSAVGNPDAPRELQDYDAVILGGVEEMDNSFISLIDNYVENGGKLLVTGFPGIRDGIGNPVDKIRLKSLGVLPDYEFFPKTQSTYFKVSDNDRASLGNDEFSDFTLIMMNSGFLKCKTIGAVQNFLRLLPHTRQGPPERVFFSKEDVTDFPGIIANSFGKGKAVFIPWQIGSQYFWKGNNAHRALFMASLHNLLQIENQLETDASPLIEMTHLGNRNGVFEWIGMINHSGQLGNGFREPVPVHNTAIRLKPLKPVKKIWLVREEKWLKFKEYQGWIEFKVPRIDDFEMALCLYK